MTANVWIIDDDENIRSALNTMCGFMGYETKTFKNPSLPKKLLEGEEKPKLIFLDVNMPQIDGFSFLKFVRTETTRENIIIVMVTSESDETMVEKAIRMGADGYVCKPINFDELKMSIRTASKRNAAKQRK